MSYEPTAASPSHEWAEGNRLFVTWHLYGSLPHALYPPPNQQNSGQALSGWTDILESDRIRAYIENNPVKAGLVPKAEDYFWSSAARKA